jgi:phosphatidylinositol alpha-1,6-mannosyltransferase
MKVLMLSPTLDGKNGWSSNAMNIAHGLRERSHEVISVTPTGPHQGDYPVIPRDMDFYSKPWLLPLIAWKVARIIRKEQPDIVHLIAEPYALLVPFWPKSITQKVVLTINGTYAIFPLNKRFFRGLALAYYRRIRCFIPISNYARTAVAARLQEIDPDIAEHVNTHATLVHIGIKLPEKMQAKPKTSGGVKHILHVGGVKHRKGVLEAIEGCAAYKARSSTPFLLTVVGHIAEESAYVQKTKRRIAELGMTNQVRIAGSVSAEELDRCYREADVFLLPVNTEPAYFEGFGIVYIEANARGVPCIGPMTSGAAEAIKEDVSGYHVDPGNPDMIAESLVNILDRNTIDPQQCIAWAKTHDTVTRTAEIEAVYTKFLRSSAHVA